MINYDTFETIVEDIIAVDGWLREAEIIGIDLNYAPIARICRCNSRYTLAKLFEVEDSKLTQFMEEIIDVFEGEVDKRDFYEEWNELRLRPSV